MLSERARAISASATVELSARVAEFRRKGVDVISLNIGEPDFGVPDAAKRAAVDAVKNDFSKYTAVDGILELREAICAKLRGDNHVEYGAGEICVSVGAKQAVMNSLLAVCSKGDEVILPVPCWASYMEMICLADATPVFVKTDDAQGYALDLDAIRRAITDRTKAIIINTPNNPSGAVYSEASLRGLAEIAVEHDLYVIADEIYEKLVYDGERHFSIASISKDVRDKCILINGFSKAYAMPGWRVGYSAGPKDVIKASKAIQSHMTSATCSISQKAALAALIGPQEELCEMVAEYDRRRQYMMKRMRTLGGMRCEMPKGTFYLLPDSSAYVGKAWGEKVIESSMDLANYLLEKGHIAVVPGEAFHIASKLRVSYSNSMENLVAGMDRMEEALNALR